MVYAYYLIEENISNIVDTWEECQEATTDKKCRFKKFKTVEEAQSWLDGGALYEDRKTRKEKLRQTLGKDVVYFDAGTGRGKGVEIRVCDFEGNSLLGFVLPEEKLNEFGNYYLDTRRTNNYGELTALYASLKYAMEYDVYKIAGDSELVINKWTVGRFSETNLDSDTCKLVKKVYKLRQEFEKKGGQVYKISGDINPADLGFHK